MCVVLTKGGCVYAAYHIDLDFQPKMAMLAKIMAHSAYTQVHYALLVCIIWVSFCCGTVLVFGHGYEEASTVGAAHCFASSNFGQIVLLSHEFKSIASTQAVRRRCGSTS